METNQEIQKLGKVHILGIGGAGMSGIARLLVAQGVTVSGSDAKDSRRVEALKKLGVKIFIGHDAKNLENVDTVIHSTAIKQNNFELKYASEIGLRILKRSDALGILTRQFETVAVSGTHGKTTTTSMVTVALQSCGLDPTFAIGSELSETGSNAHLGESKYFVVEADESDGTFLQLSPKVVIVTNVEADHLDHWQTLDRIENAFVEFTELTKTRNGFAVICQDDPGAKKLIQVAKSKSVKVLTYGQSSDSDLVISNLKLGIPGPTFDLIYKGKNLGNISLKVLGTHNALNAAAALLVGLELGFDFGKLKQGISNFSGTRRRFEFKGSVNGIRVYDDYAHHPTEITATLKAARDVVKDGQIIVAFQAHHYYRTALFNKEFGEALGLADKVVVLEVFAPGEEAIPGASGQTMASFVPLPKSQVIFEPSLLKVSQHLVTWANPNDIIMTLGAGDIGLLAPEVLSLLENK
ncbi:MAG: UDP-N-acetylmuramate--L-alanine ligase [Candidatus Nanopelagicales bacterium]